jgi:Xaa-Pro dipeptidase
MKAIHRLHITENTWSGIVLLLAASSSIYSQTRVEPLPKLLSVREQQAVRESWLKKRLDTMLLPMMRQQKIEMWIVTNEEFHADPVTEYIALRFLMWAGATFLFLPIAAETNSIALLSSAIPKSISSTSLKSEPARRDIAATLQRIVDERKPKTIALNMGGTRGATTGLTHDTYKFLTESVGPDYASRFVSAAPLIVEYMDTRCLKSWKRIETRCRYRHTDATRVFKRSDYTGQNDCRRRSLVVSATG